MASVSTTWFDRLRTAGILPGDSEDVRLSKSLLTLATGLESMASILWLVIYEFSGVKLSATIPFVIQLLLTTNFMIYILWGNFRWFLNLQLSLFLFAPFVVQWSIGNFITASGVVLWGLLGPIGAILCISTKESIAWFIAWVVLVAVSGYADYYLLDTFWRPTVPINSQVSLLFFAINFISVSTVIYLLLRYAFLEKQRNYSRYVTAHHSLVQEQNRAERLLLNILPSLIAKRLKEGEEPIADGHADVTVLFADIEGFTQRAMGMSPVRLFTLLNTLFSKMDDLAGQYRLEKIKTIGDAYMVAGGLPGTHDEYTAAVVAFAVDVSKMLSRNADEWGAIKLHVGICTGPVVAGVVGKRKFIYDMWGDTVNIASRLCSESKGGSILLDHATYLRTRDRYKFDAPLSLDLKGRGMTSAYLLNPNNF